MQSTSICKQFNESLVYIIITCYIAIEEESLSTNTINRVWSGVKDITGIQRRTFYKGNTSEYLVIVTDDDMKFHVRPLHLAQKKNFILKQKQRNKQLRIHLSNLWSHNIYTWHPTILVPSKEVMGFQRGSLSWYSGKRKRSI